MATLSSLAEHREFVRIATDALGRYRLRTALSVLGVVLGVAAVIAMMSVSEGAARDALSQVEALGLNNLVARSFGPAGTASAASWRGLRAGDAARVGSLVPLTRMTSPLLERYVRLASGEHATTGPVLGVGPEFAAILGLSLARGRFVTTVDTRALQRTCVLGATLARRLFAYHDPTGERIRVGQDYYHVVGVLREHGGPARAGALAWRDVNEAAFVPISTLSGRTLAVSPNQPADEIWLQISAGERASDLALVFKRALLRPGGPSEFTVVVPRELLAQRYRTQRTFAIVVGSVAVLALVVGGIGIMNIMLTSVVERTREIGIRRTVGATRREITWQFLIETLLMTVGGGLLGIAAGAGASYGITAFAGWSTHVSTVAVFLGFTVSVLVGLVFGLYPAMQAAQLDPVDAMRYE